MPQVESIKHTKGPMVLAVVGSGLVVVALTCGLIWLKLHPTTPKVTTKEVVNQAADKLARDDKAGAIADLNAQLKQAKTAEDKVALYLWLGSAYQNQGDKTKAMAAYKKAEAIKPSYGINDSIARLAEDMGDKAMALSYYQRNRKLVKDGTESLHAEELPALEEKIVKLGGKL